MLLVWIVPGGELFVSSFAWRELFSWHFIEIVHQSSNFTESEHAHHRFVQVVELIDSFSVIVCQLKVTLVRGNYLRSLGLE